MKIVINPKYKHLTQFVESVPSIFPTQGESIYKARNEIKVFNVDGIAINVKAYKVPIFINRIVYSFFRETKAQRAYDYALKLLSLGVETPAPIAYIIETRGGLVARTYFISLHTPLDGNFRLFGDVSIPFETVRPLAEAFARYTAELHEKQVLHVDYSPGNILFEKKEDGSYRFSLIDINRMKFCEVDEREGCKAFARMWGIEEFFRTVARVYAEARGFDVERCTKLILDFQNEEQAYRDRKYARRDKIAAFKEKLKNIF
ncbi:MAG: lipopolysaccharide kinase InaA family protein [Paludibacteraceae bacterium]|nr:lipopolysaccharide kinase InaA family protein [Paludibacteraceae bacterium]